MKFKHTLERWHKIREFAEELAEMADFREIEEIRKCVYYEFDNRSAEEYCHHPSKLGEYGAAFPLNGKSQEICWQCKIRDTKEAEG